MTKRNQGGINNPNYKHGMGGTKIYSSWADMKKRCDNPNSVAYENYGGRGISYDPRWKYFISFYEDMCGTYSEGLTLERKDVDKGYSKENCIWVSKESQARNTRIRKDNNTGKVGVYVGRTNGKPTHYVATVCLPNKIRKTKWFSIERFGDNMAFKLACNYRNEELKSLDEQGVVYGKHHK